MSAILSIGDCNNKCTNIFDNKRFVKHQALGCVVDGVLALIDMLGAA